MNCTLGIPVYDEFLTYDFLVNIEGYTASFYNNYPIFAGSDFAARWHEDNELLGLNEGDLVFCKIVNELNDLDINKKYAYGTQLTVVDYDSLTKFIIPPRPLIKFIGIIRKYDL